MNFYSGKIMSLKENEIFVFGSNPEGRHGFGMAKLAKEKYGAVYGKGRGLMGRSYALPTKNLKAGFVERYVSAIDGAKKEIVYPLAGEKSLYKKQIRENIEELYAVAKLESGKTFLIVYMNDSKNLNGYSSEEIFDLFSKDIKVPKNIVFSDTFRDLAIKNGLIESKEEGSWKIEVVNVKKNQSVKEDNDYVYCGRGSALGNPFAMENYSNEERDRVCDSYQVYVEKELKEGNQKIRAQLNEIWAVAKEKGGVKLGCYCAPQRCHCDTIKSIIEKKFVELRKKSESKKEKSEKPINP